MRRGNRRSYPLKSARIANFRRVLLVWFRANGRSFPWRERSSTTYRLTIAEILLQRTQAEVAKRFLPKFLRAYSSWASLAREDERRLGEFLRPLGLWRRRAKSLSALAKELVKRDGRMPTRRDELETLPGVGQYIASAILLSCYRGREPLLDVNMSRVLERYFGPRKLADIRYDTYLQRLSREVISVGDPRILNWGILDFGALICRPRQPLCDRCPLASGCSSFPLFQGAQSRV